MTEYKSNFKIIEISIYVLLLQKNERFSSNSYMKMLKGCEEMLILQNILISIANYDNVIAILRNQQVPFRVCVFCHSNSATQFQLFNYSVV